MAFLLVGGGAVIAWVGFVAVAERRRGWLSRRLAREPRPDPLQGVDGPTLAHSAQTWADPAGAEADGVDLDD